MLRLNAISCERAAVGYASGRFETAVIIVVPRVDEKGLGRTLCRVHSMLRHSNDRGAREENLVHPYIAGSCAPSSSS